MWTDEQLAFLRRHMELREARDLAKEAATKAEKEYRESEADLWDTLTKDGEVPVKDAGVRVPLGEPWGTVTFSPRETFYGRILDDDLAAQWLEENALADEFLEEKFVGARLNEIVRTRIEQRQPLPPGFDFSPRRGVTITRRKA